MKEGLGYRLQWYTPCFNYNSDRFCCSKRGDHFRKNVLLSDCNLTPSNDYSAPRNYDPNDQRPLWVKVTGMVDPDPYTFTPQDRWNIWCGRMPCNINQKGVPCQANQPYCNNPGNCAKGTC